MIKYGQDWGNNVTELQVELSCIAKRAPYGVPIFDHFMAARKLAWPDRYRHRWSDLMYSEFVTNDITILCGAASTQKTSHASEFVLLNYWANPQTTLVILSTIDMAKLDTGVWAEVKMLHQTAKERYPFLAGHVIDHKKAITTDNLKEDGDRDFRKGILSRPCFVGSKWVGLGKLLGTKQVHLFYLCDEIQHMAPTFIESWANLFSNGNVKIIGSGNPKHDPDDQLGIAAEPEEGWPSVAKITKTTCWKTRFLNGRTVNLVGIDSPNFDVPEGQPEPYPKLIGRKFQKRIAHDWKENSPKYWEQVMGVMQIDMADKRVITRQLCREHFAQTAPVWSGAPKTRVYGLDPSYGGGDECIAVVLEFGPGDDGLELINIVKVIEINIDMTLAEKFSAEEQVAEHVKQDLAGYDIDVENAFYDPYGKGTIGFAFGHKFGDRTPIPVDSGGRPTDRPVRNDLYVFDEETQTKRHKKCSEHYLKFVTEAWFSVRYCIEADQLRGLPTDMMVEGCARRYEDAPGNKLSVESKEDYKERAKHSPNRFDALAVAVEGARQRGFRIAKLGNGNIKTSTKSEDWFESESREYSKAIQDRLLTHARA